MTRKEKKLVLNVLNIMLENKSLFNHNGLCSWNSSLYINKHITDKEFVSMNNYLDNYKIDNWLWGYWWKKGEIKPRIDWINHHIKTLQNKSSSNFFKRILGLDEIEKYD